MKSVKLSHTLRPLLALGAILGLLASAAPGEGWAKTADARGAEPKIGLSTELPIPRFASVKTDPARLRRGPGVDYPILWELTRRRLPVKIIGEYGHWRRVELHDGARGWIHKALLNGRRYAVLTGGAGELYEEPRDDAAPAARVEAAFPLRLARCRAVWCEVEADGVRGWAPKRRLWGVEPNEVFD